MSLDGDLSWGCGHELPTFTDRMSSAFAVERHSSAVSSMDVLINYATGCMNRKDGMAGLASASITDVDWVQRSMLRPNVLSNAPFDHVGKYRLHKFLEGIFLSTFYCGSASYETVGERVFSSILPRLKWISRVFATSCTTVRRIYSRMCGSESVSGFTVTCTDSARVARDREGLSRTSYWKAS